MVDDNRTAPRVTTAQPRGSTMRGVNEPFDPRLDDAILADPTATPPREVLADFLEQHGHPRAELIRLAIARMDTAAWHRAHRDVLGLLDKGVTLTWLHGYADEVTLTNVHDVKADALWPTIATHRTYRFARALRIIRSDLRFDAALPPPDGLRWLTIYYWGPETLRSLANVRLPRVTELQIDRHMSAAVLDADAIAPAFAGLPALEDLVVTKCLNAAAVESLLRCIVQSPLKARLRSLTLDRFTEAAARTIIDANFSIDLSTERDSLSTATRKRLHRVLRRWKVAEVERAPRPDRSTAAPRHAPADFASMPPVQQTLDQNGWVTEWAGSGVHVDDHPVGTNIGTRCSACEGANTMIVWARSEHVYTHGGWNESDVKRYELVCRECGRFTKYED